MNRKRVSRAPGHRREQGMTLLVVMLLVIVAGLLGVTAASMGNVDERVARNARDQNIALQAAEAALRDARQDLLSDTTLDGAARSFAGATGATANCNAAGYRGFCMPAAAGATAVWKTALKDDARSVGFGEATARPNDERFRDASTQGGVRLQPRYVIEPISDPDEILLTGALHYVYRVTAIGYGAITGTEVIVQEVVRIPAM